MNVLAIVQRLCVKALNEGTLGTERFIDCAGMIQRCLI